MYFSQITGRHIRGGLPEMIYDTSDAKMRQRVAEGRRHTDARLWLHAVTAEAAAAATRQRIYQNELCVGSPNNT